MATIKLSRAFRRMFLKGVFGPAMSADELSFATTVGQFKTSIHTTSAVTHYLFAYGATTPTTTFTSITTPITIANSGAVAGLLRLNTTPAPITFQFVSDVSTSLFLTTVYMNNAAQSGLITIPAGSIVYYVGIFPSSETNAECHAWIRLSNPAVGYNYEEQGTLRIPAAGYTVAFPV